MRSVNLPSNMISACARDVYHGDLQVKLVLRVFSNLNHLESKLRVDVRVFQLHNILRSIL